MLQHTWLRWLGTLLVAAFVAVPAYALDRGVYLVDGTTEYYFVDELGTRHIIQDFDTTKTRWFMDMPVVTTKVDVINALPAGEIITATVGPEVVVKKTTTTTVDDRGLRSRTTRTVEEVKP